ncbi:phosphotriesterase [Rhodococcus hoagii]|nr:phosphotriesterase [Prescottella equi]
MPVNTVLGPRDSSELGQTLIHEHIVTADWSMRMAFGEHYYEHDVIVDRAVAQFRRARESGVRTVVDGTPVNMGRDIGLIREVAERSGVDFVVSSGFYYQEEVFLNWRSEDEIHSWLSRECAEGIAGTGVRPGIMKAACADDGITPILDRVFRAIGRVAAEQRLPIFCHHHTEVGNGEAILDLFEDCGVAPSQVVLGHSGDTNDLGYLEKMLRRGCYLGMDRFGHCAVGNGLQDRVGTVVELCARGYGDRLLLSHDLATYFGVFGSWQDFKADESVKPAVDFTFINTNVVPALESAGLDPEAVRAMLERNPAEFLEVH